jgi:Lrp/AsnC family leucine-responsive transcriptional regulator
MLNQDARTSLKQMGHTVGLSTSGVRRRIKKMEKEQIITGYTVRLNPKHLGQGVLAYITVEVDEGSASSLINDLSKCREVCEIHKVTGSHNLLIKVRTKDLDSLNHFINGKIKPSGSIRNSQTTVVIETLKETQINP